MKLAVIGGGGVRAPFLAKSLALRASTLGIEEIVFADIDPQKLSIYGGLSKNIAFKIQPKLNFTTTTDMIYALTDADYVITTIRVGGDGLRAKDERIALSSGVIGQETVGAAGFSFALRSIPALSNYCALVGKYSAKNCKVLNFTNPAGLVSQALRDLGFDFTYGICDAPSGLLRQFAKLLDSKASNVSGICYGLNHLSFFESVVLKGENVTKRILTNPDTYLKTDMRYFSQDFAEKKGCALNEYLYYYYYPERVLSNMLASSELRGETIERLNKEMLSELVVSSKDCDFDQTLTIFEKYYGLRENAYMSLETGVLGKSLFKFDIYSDNDSGYAAVALDYISLEQGKTKGDIVLCVPNNGAICGLEDSDVVEITCSLGANGCIPYKVLQIPFSNLELIRRIKAYERIATKAILNSDLDLAIDALYLHPLVNSYSIAQTLAREYFSLNKDFLVAR
jgi:6-phospho-beta-glucosidase